MCFQRDGNETAPSLCSKSNVGYEGECSRCEESIYKYVGETSKTGYSRIKQHLASYRAAHKAKLPPLPARKSPTDQQAKDVKSWMWKHTRDVHGGLMGDQEGKKDYHFTVSGCFRKCLQRQLEEGLRIRMAENDGCVLLNSKNEWFTPKLVETIFKQF